MILGYSRGFHDAGLAIIEEDGTVSYASNSERYSKIKYDPQLTPELESMIKKDDYVVFYQDLELNSEKYDYSPNPTFNLELEKFLLLTQKMKLESLKVHER